MLRFHCILYILRNQEIFYTLILYTLTKLKVSNANFVYFLALVENPTTIDISKISEFSLIFSRKVLVLYDNLYYNNLKSWH